MERQWALQSMANPRVVSKRMMDLALEETVELISFTQGKQFKYVFINECEHCISI